MLTPPRAHKATGRLGQPIQGRRGSAVPMLCGIHAADLPINTQEDGSVAEVVGGVHVAASCELLLLSKLPERAKSPDKLPWSLPDQSNIWPLCIKPRAGHARPVPSCVCV